MALTREQVVGAAVGVLTEFGLADLSMRRLARELDVQVGALYWHVKNKQELLVDVAARLLGDIPQPAPAGGDGTAPDPAKGTTAARAEVAALASAVRSALIPVPDSAEVVQLAQTLQPAALGPLTRLRELLEAAGVPPQHSAWAQHLLLNHVLGSVAAHQDRATLAAVEATGGPELGEDAFHWGLDAVLDGMLGRAV